MGAPLLFNPSRASTEELNATFVGRWPLLERLERDILADAAGTTARHWNLIGPRGSGKSHITELLGRKLVRDHGWAVVRLPEEHYQISNAADFLEQILVRLPGHEGPSPFAEEPDAARVEELALDRLRRWRSETKKPLLVILENLGSFLHGKVRSQRDQKRLREILMRDAPFVLLTTATSYIDDLTRHAAPFYDFFQVEVLQDLSQREVADLIEARAEWDQDKELLAHRQTLRHRAEAIFHFSGGNPRLVLELYKVLRRGVTEELHKQLLQLLDEVTPYYQARLSDLQAPQAERVLTELALAEGPITPSEVARRMRISTNQVTAVITKLQAERFVRPAGRPDARRRYYDLTDRLFRIWMQMREDRGARRRLRFLTMFFQRWYEGMPQELQAATGRVSDAFWAGLQEGHPAVCGDMLTTLDYLQEALPGEVPALRLLSRPIDEISADALERTAVHLSKMIDREGEPDRLVPLNFLLACIRRRQGRDRDVLAALRSATALDHRRDALLWAAFLSTLRVVEGAAAALDAGRGVLAQENAPHALYWVVAEIAAHAGETDEALRLMARFLQGERPASRRAFVLRRLAVVLMKAGAMQEADQVLTQARLFEQGPAQQLLEQLYLYRSGRGSLAALRAVWMTMDLSSLDLSTLYALRDAVLKPQSLSTDDFELLAELWRRESNVVLSAAMLLAIFRTLLDSQSSDVGKKAQIEAWLRNHASPSQLKDVFLSVASLVRTRPEVRPSLIRFYRDMRERGFLDEDVQPYAETVRVLDAPDREQALFGLHPELREAVELLLSEDAVADAPSPVSVH